VPAWAGVVRSTSIVNRIFNNWYGCSWGRSVVAWLARIVGVAFFALPVRVPVDVVDTSIIPVSVRDSPDIVPSVEGVATIVVAS